jgi:hypothetical protein
MHYLKEVFSLPVSGTIKDEPDDTDKETNPNPGLSPISEGK